MRLFIRMAEAAQATITPLPGPASIPAAVVSYLDAHDLPLSLRIAGDPEIAGLDWAACPALTVQTGRAEAGDAASLTSCIAGIAETGTLMLASGPLSPTTLNFLPDAHIVVLPRERIVATYEEGWARIGTMPRLVTFITGPSRTADIEQRLVLGAHGPRRLHILMLGVALHE